MTTIKCPHEVDTEANWEYVRGQGAEFIAWVCVCCGGPSREGEDSCRACGLDEYELAMKRVPYPCALKGCGRQASYLVEGTWRCADHR